MKLAILHLSDIHLSDAANLPTARVPAIVGAMRSAAIGVKHCFIAVTGDVAATGAPDEYAVARRMMCNLLHWLREDLHLETLNLVLVPGNHDCNFRNTSELRDLVLENLPQYIDTIDPAGEFVNTCLSVQRDFMVFEASANERTEPLPLAQQLHRREVVEIDGYVVRFECFNTAWLSRRQEVQGSLLFPISAIRAYDGAAATDLVVSLFHHPYAWLQPSNRRELQRYIEQTSDIVLSGHEHDPDFHRTESIGGEQIEYIEGATLQTSDPAQSGFNILLIDTDAKEQTLVSYEWKVDRYERAVDTGPRPFVRNRHADSGAFVNSPVFVKTLLDPGRGFNHPHKQELHLSDIFVYPDVRQRSLQALVTDPDQKAVDIKGQNLLPYLVSKKLVLFIAEKDGGKTALAKTLYADLQRLHGLVPVMVSGGSIRNLRDLRRAADKSFGDQYSLELRERFWQLPAERRALVLDDFHLVPLNRKTQCQLIAQARELFGTVLIFADDLYGFQQLAAQESDPQNPFPDFDHCEICPLGHVVRHRLIRKWVTLGREHILEEPDIAKEVTTKERTINALIGKNLIPPLPVLILIILQAAEAARGVNIISGAYGYLYEVLITESLSSASSDITDTGAKYTYLSRLAFHMFTERRETLPDSEVEEITAHHAQEYRAAIDHARLLCELTASQVVQRGSGGLGFRYRYFFYYFVARYFRDAMADPEQKTASRARLYELADHVFCEAYANILVFYLYLTKDVELIKYLLCSSKAIFDEYKPCDLDGDVAHINELYFAPQRRELVSAGTEENRESYLCALDEEIDQIDRQLSEPETVQYHSALNVSLKFNIAFKMLQLLGQIVKNFPGELKGDLKLEITSECYHLGLRALSAFVTLSRTEYEGMKELIDGLLRERQRVNPDAVLPSVERVILGVCLAAAFGVLKRISYAVGHEQLELTYRDVLRVQEERLGTRMVDLSIKFDHFPKVPPSRDVEKLERDLRKNPFCYTLLQDLVYLFLYLFPTTFNERQKLAGLVGIRVRDPRLLETGRKLLPPPSTSQGKTSKKGKRRKR